MIKYIKNFLIKNSFQYSKFQFIIRESSINQYFDFNCSKFCLFLKEFFINQYFYFKDIFQLNLILIFKCFTMNSTIFLNLLNFNFIINLIFYFIMKNFIFFVYDLIYYNLIISNLYFIKSF